MKVFAIDWAAFLAFLDPWGRLEPAGRKLLLDAQPRGVLSRRALGGGLAALLDGGFVTPMVDGTRVRLADAFLESHRVLRALERHPLLLRADGRAFREYLAEHMTGVERVALLGERGWLPNRDERLLKWITSAGHVRGFLAAEDVQAWEREHRPAHSDTSSEREWSQTRSFLKGPHSVGDLVGLVQTLRAAGRPLRLSALDVPGASNARLGRALEAALRYLLAFAALDAELQPVVMLWPAVAERLSRKPRPVPSIVTPDETFSSPLRMEDLTRFLVRAADEATATRVLAAAGAGKLERLSASVLALLDSRHKAALLRQCRKAGIFLEESRAPAPKVPRRFRGG